MSFEDHGRSSHGSDHHGRSAGDGDRGRDVLISRIVDRAERPADWDALERIERSGVPVRAELLASLRADASVREAIGVSVDAAAGVSLDVPARSDRSARRPTFAAAAGWLVALLVVCGWSVDRFGSRHSRDGVPRDGHVRVHEAQRAASSATSPRRILDAEPLADGAGYAVLCVREVFERVVVDDLYQLSEDEHGQPVPIPVQPAAVSQPWSF